MRITRVYLDVDMRQNFDGLNKVMASAKVAIGNSSPTTVILFINRKRTAFKMLADKYMVFYKSDHGPIPLDALKYLPQVFGGSPTEMNEAIRKSLEQKLGTTTKEKSK